MHFFMQDQKKGGSVCFDFDPLLSRAKASLSKTLFCDIFIFLCPLNEREGERTRERRGKHPTLMQYNDSPFKYTSERKGRQ